MVEPKLLNHRIQIIKNQQLVKIKPSTSTNKLNKTTKLNYIFIVGKKQTIKSLTSKVNKRKDLEEKSKLKQKKQSKIMILKALKHNKRNSHQQSHKMFKLKSIRKRVQWKLKSQYKTKSIKLHNSTKDQNNHKD